LRVSENKSLNSFPILLAHLVNVLLNLDLLALEMSETMSFDYSFFQVFASEILRTTEKIASLLPLVIL
jgi:hypothetical protein